MKKRTFIVAALAMAALVGCQKDLMPEPASKVDGSDLAERPFVSNVTLSAGDAVTRIERGNNVDWKFKEGDQVGAMLTDKISTINSSLVGYDKEGDYAFWTYSDYVKGVKKELSNVQYLFTKTYKNTQATEFNDAREFYDITQEVWTNYPYNQIDGSKTNFQTEARLVEGNYIYYTPYNEAVQTRGPLMVTLPVKQTVTPSETSDPEGSFSAVEEFFAGKDPVLATITYLSAAAADTKVNARMQPIFAYPKFTIINNFNGYLFDCNIGGKNNAYYISTTNEKKQYTMKLKQIELYTGDNSALNYKTALKAQALDEVVRETADVTRGWNTVANNYETAKTSAVLDSKSPYNQAYEFTTAENEYKVENDIIALEAKKSNRIVLDMGDYELAPNAEYSFHVVMPAEDYTEAGLYATILVEIEGKEYYIRTNEVVDNVFNADATIAGMNVSTVEGSDWKGYAYFDKTKKVEGTTDYRFVDRHDHASDNIVLVRGERFPVAEINADRTAKLFKGDLLKIELVGGMSQIAVAKYVKPEDKPVTPETPKGIKGNDDFKDYLNSVHRDAHVKEVAKWDDDNATFNFLTPCEVVINADILEALENRLPDGSITLNTNLPIAAGVSVELVKDKTYEFSANGHKYQITYTQAFPNSNEVVNGINVNVSGEIKAKDEMVTGAVVFTSGDTKLKNPAGIVTINVAKNATLSVNATADVTATILAPEATVEIVNGSKNLTNPNNKFDKVINSALVAFEGPANTVEYSCFGWDIAPIAANTKVNFLKINPTTASEIHSFEIDDAAVALVANLKDVTIELGSNITDLTSKSNVTLTNILKLTAVNSKIIWNINGSNPVVVSNAKAIDKTKIEAGEGVTFVD